MFVKSETIYIKIVKGLYTGCGGYLINDFSENEKIIAMIWHKKRKKNVKLCNHEFECIEPYNSKDGGVKWIY